MSVVVPHSFPNQISPPHPSKHIFKPLVFNKLSIIALAAYPMIGYPPQEVKMTITVMIMIYSLNNSYSIVFNVYHKYNATHPMMCYLYLN